MAVSVSETVATAARLVSRADIAAKAEAGNAQDEEVALLVRCFNLVESELALDIFPLTRVETLEAGDGFLPFSAFKNPPVKIVSVRSTSDMGIPFSVTEGGIALKRPATSVQVKYIFAPSEKPLLGSSENNVSMRLMAYGTAAQYLLSVGRFEESAAFEAKFRDAVRAANLIRHKLAVRARRWA